MTKKDDNATERPASPIEEATPAPPPIPRINPGQPNRIDFIVRPWEPERLGFGAAVLAPRHNEEGVLEVCQWLVDYLKARGGNWSDPSRPSGTEQGIDCVCSSPEGAVNLQVTRAICDTEFWATLAKNKGVTAYTTAADASSDLWQSILRKATHTPPVDRASITLVLDASETFIYKNSQVIEVFRTEFGDLAKALGFKAIWVVGPQHSFATQLA